MKQFALAQDFAVLAFCAFQFMADVPGTRAGQLPNAKCLLE
jgi:hypothetical protein